MRNIFGTYWTHQTCIKLVIHHSWHTAGALHSVCIAERTVNPGRRDLCVRVRCSRRFNGVSNNDHMYLWNACVDACGCRAAIPNVPFAYAAGSHLEIVPALRKSTIVIIITNMQLGCVLHSRARAFRSGTERSPLPRACVFMPVCAMRGD